MWKNFLCVFMMTTGFEQNMIGFKLTMYSNLLNL